MDNNNDFAQMLENSFRGLNLKFKKGQKVNGTVSGIDSDSIFVDLHATTEGVIAKAEFLNDQGELTISTGDPISAYVISQDYDEGILLTTQMGKEMIDSHLEEAYNNQIPVEGKFKQEGKGGWSVEIGSTEAFCPFSQVGLYSSPDSPLTGVKTAFLITQIRNRDVVVSHRKVLDLEREKLRESLQAQLNIGDRLTGKVVRILDFGVFVDLGGIDGMIPVSELSWSGKRVRPEDILNVGDEVAVLITGIDWAKNRIALSYRGAQQSWAELIGDLEPGMICEGKVTRLESFGAFIEMAEDVEGLLHISQLGKKIGKRLNHANEACQIGDLLMVRIDDIDLEKHRLGLSLAKTKNEIEETAIMTNPSEIQNDSILNGTVSEIKPFGVIITFENGQTGLLHKSETENRIQHKMGDSVMVKVKSMNDGRIGLMLYSEANESEQAAVKEWKKNKNQDQTSFGNIGSMFDQLKF